jgi:hypothetical protein
MLFTLIITKYRRIYLLISVLKSINIISKLTPPNNIPISIPRMVSILIPAIFL